MSCLIAGQHRLMLGDVPSIRPLSNYCPLWFVPRFRSTFWDNWRTDILWNISLRRKKTRTAEQPNSFSNPKWSHRRTDFEIGVCVFTWFILVTFLCYSQEKLVMSCCMDHQFFNAWSAWIMYRATLEHSPFLWNPLDSRQHKWCQARKRIF